MHGVYEEQGLRAVENWNGRWNRHRLLPVSRARCHRHKISPVLGAGDLQNRLGSRRQHALLQHSDARRKVLRQSGGKEKLVKIGKPESTHSRDVQNGSLFGFAQVDIEVLLELHEKLAKCLLCLWFRRYLTTRFLSICKRRGGSVFLARVSCSV